MTRLLKSFRMVRVLRLLRLAKLQRMFIRAKDHIHSELVFKAFTIIQLLVAVIFANHFMCAIWYFIGDLNLEEGNENWIEATGVQDKTLDYRYFTSLHWSLAHFGLGPMQISPQNSSERVYAILMMFSGMLVFSFFTAYITNALVQVSANQTEGSKQLWLLRRYLRQNKVPTMLTYRVLRYAEFKCKSTKETLPESRVTIIEELSDHLRSELRYECNFTIVVQHPLFENCFCISDVALHQMSILAFSSKAFAAADSIFKSQSWQRHMYFVCKGELYYKKVTTPISEKASAGEGLERVIMRNEWMCEPALWVQWMTRGSVIADTDCEVVLVDVKAFAECAKNDEIIYAMVTLYAENYAEWLNDQELSSLVDVYVGDKTRKEVEGFCSANIDETAKERDKRLKKKRQMKAKEKKGNKELPARKK
jgi:hypothetical protein